MILLSFKQFFNSITNLPDSKNPKEEPHRNSNPFICTPAIFELNKKLKEETSILRRKTQNLQNISASS